MWISKKKYRAMKETIKQLEKDKKELQTQCDKYQQKGLKHKAVYHPRIELPEKIIIHRYYERALKNSLQKR